ncbi:hypothetical protein OHA79_44775 (plasmid) [Streptomyces sp. NBC_00841]|uniref:hypothetical protein n=1 Tax=unclassified Streptomyces TaxID=2593676 RepID=UPI00224F2E21|nr:MULTISPECIES: hypothetical protein [unclassified Streptomyces]MCX4538974.1 hypothetical protein [Streptomyces sp. NBC_01669]WSA04794.1 hypothetical protein OHA79_44775 [Streptomyces sp. NBC_00841]
MSVELGQLFDAAVEHIRRARPLASDDGYTGALLASTLDILIQLDIYSRELNWDGAGEEGEPPAAMEEATVHLRSHLIEATNYLHIASRLKPPATAGATTPLHDALAALAASRDLLHTHRGPDRQLLTPYALLLTQAGSQKYLALRITDVTWELGRLATDMAERSDPAQVEALQSARRELDQATVLGRAATRDTYHETGSLPAAPDTRPIPFVPAEPPAKTLTHLENASEQLLRIAFAAARTPTGEPRLTGFDLPQLARSLALTRLLSAQLLQHISANSPDTQLALHAELQTSARRWNTVAEAWHHLVDLNDPSARPLLPRYDYLTRQRSQAVPPPQPLTPHPACEIAATQALRTGRLLYGPDWQPHAGSRTHPPRPRASLLADTEGAGPVLHTLYRMSMAGRHLAAAIPALIEKAAHSLVTDSIEHRPPKLPTTMRFYPAHHRQIEQINEEYRAAGVAEGTLCTKLLHQAQAAGRPIARARLDAAITEIYPPDRPALSAQQEKILERIIADIERRTEHFTSAVQRAVHQPQNPPHPHNHTPAARHPGR